MNDTTRERPAAMCRQLLVALEAAEGRSRRRKRDQRPDAIGLAIKRELLAAAVAEDPEPAAFEEWLVARTLAAGHAAGPIRAMALTILDEWRVASAAPGFRGWLVRGAPSDDRLPAPAPENPA